MQPQSSSDAKYPLLNDFFPQKKMGSEYLVSAEISQNRSVVFDHHPTCALFKIAVHYTTRAQGTPSSTFARTSRVLFLLLVSLGAKALDF
jgi:hypothetical protein